MVNIADAEQDNLGLFLAFLSQAAAFALLKLRHEGEMGNQESHSEESKEYHRGPETTNNFVDLHQKVDQLPTHNSQFAIAGTFFAVMLSLIHI